MTLESLGLKPEIVTPESLGLTGPISQYVVIGLYLRFGPYQGDHPQHPIDLGNPLLPVWLAYPPTGNSNKHSIIRKDGTPSALKFNFSKEFGLTFFRGGTTHFRLIPYQETIAGSTIHQPLNQRQD